MCCLGFHLTVDFWEFSLDYGCLTRSTKPVYYLNYFVIGVKFGNEMIMLHKLALNASNTCAYPYIHINGDTGHSKKIVLYSCLYFSVMWLITLPFTYKSIILHLNQYQTHIPVSMMLVFSHLILQPLLYRGNMNSRFRHYWN